MEALIADRALQIVDVKRVGVDNDQRRIAAQPVKNRLAKGADAGAIFHEQPTMAPVHWLQHLAYGKTRRRDDRADHARIFDEATQENTCRAKPLDEALNLAIKSKKTPFIISDMGDNPTAGGAGDVTWTLHEILKRPEFLSDDGPNLIYASIPGPELVEKAIKAGIGNEIEAFVSK